MQLGGMDATPQHHHWYFLLLPLILQHAASSLPQEGPTEDVPVVVLQPARVLQDVSPVAAVPHDAVANGLEPQMLQRLYSHVKELGARGHVEVVWALAGCGTAIDLRLKEHSVSAAAAFKRHLTMSLMLLPMVCMES